MAFAWLSNLFNFNHGEEAPLHLQPIIPALDRIGTIRQMLPRRQRGWLFELGLYVLKRDAMGMTRIQAGGANHFYVDLWREHPHEAFRVRKFKPGEWEKLVWPSLKLAEWLFEHNGLPPECQRAFVDSIWRFRWTGVFNYPDCGHEIWPL